MKVRSAPVSVMTICIKRKSFFGIFFIWSSNLPHKYPVYVNILITSSRNIANSITRLYIMKKKNKGTKMRRVSPSHHGPTSDYLLMAPNASAARSFTAFFTCLSWPRFASAFMFRAMRISPCLVVVIVSSGFLGFLPT